MATKKVTFTLKKETIEKVKELAREEGRSFSNMVQRILEKYFRNKKNGK